MQVPFWQAELLAFKILGQLTFVAKLSSTCLFYREKLAYITTVNMQVPVLPSESKEDVSQVEDLLQDGRMGHEV